MSNFLKNITTPFIVAIIASCAVFVAVPIYKSNNIEPQASETTSATLKTPEEVAEFIAQQLIEGIRNCPKAHELHAMFSDGTTETVYVPPFSEMLEAVDGDESILVREFAAMVLIALMNGAVEFQFTHAEDKGLGV